MYTIMMVEDEQQLRSITAEFLRREGYTVLEAANGEEALRLAAAVDTVHLYVLDWMLPGMDGVELCRKIRERTYAPVIFLTAKSEELDKLSVLELGADDYLTKPFSIRELAVRIKVLLRRAYLMGETEINDGVSNDQDTIWERGKLRIDHGRFAVFVHEEQMILTPTEFKILCVLCKVPGRVYSRLQLLEHAMGETYAGYERTIDTHIRNLRKKLEHNPDEPEMLKTVFGIGYKFEAIQ
ncbi:response regulator transcription factor [Marinicrinis lubricantis]|uniref:Response regulator transcription factor n=1 Tax=Marinicrinis lubricantis TaxID=2086470 RepID=A0ABW1ILA7_9BACL